MEQVPDAGQGAVPGGDPAPAGPPGDAGRRLVPGRVVGRRRQANVAGGRRAMYQVLVTEAERERLVALADEAGVSVPRLLAESALAGSGETPTQRHVAMVELFAVRRLLAGVSINLNQVARHANASPGFPAEAGAVVGAVRRVVGRLDEALEDLANNPAGEARRARAAARAEARPAPAAGEGPVSR